MWLCGFYYPCSHVFFLFVFSVLFEHGDRIDLGKGEIWELYMRLVHVFVILHALLSVIFLSLLVSVVGYGS